MYHWSVSWANQAFDSLLPIIDEYVAENQKNEGLFFKNFEAQMSSNSGMTQIAQQRRYFPLETLKFNTPFQLSACVKLVSRGMEVMLHHSQAPLSKMN